jgi:hypothetical protein
LKIPQTTLEILDFFTDKKGMTAVNQYQYALVDDEMLIMQAAEYEFPTVDPRLMEEVRRRGLEPHLLRALSLAQAILDYADKEAA